ncbi:hypothetical protein ACFT7S_11155 [Streptomyces sp. NPDC057136]|uniref:hypothetical protein n=1 Tax=Streptomyces sp. NPDC057136 TaxID=3346029 RepID=UPI0036256612
MSTTQDGHTLGMRGTCSPSFDLSTTFEEAQILPVPFGDIAARTMVPLSHLLWSGVWAGLAAEAVDRAARRDLDRPVRGDAGFPQPRRSETGQMLSWIFQSIVLVLGRVIAPGQVIVARYVESDFRRSGDAAERGSETNSPDSPRGIPGFG